MRWGFDVNPTIPFPVWIDVTQVAAHYKTIDATQRPEITLRLTVTERFGQSMSVIKFVFRTSNPGVVSTMESVVGLHSYAYAGASDTLEN